MIAFSVSVRRFGLEAGLRLQAAAGQAPLNASLSTTEAPEPQLPRVESFVASTEDSAAASDGVSET